MGENGRRLRKGMQAAFADWGRMPLTDLSHLSVAYHTDEGPSYTPWSLLQH